MATARDPVDPARLTEAVALYRVGVAPPSPSPAALRRLAVPLLVMAAAAACVGARPTPYVPSSSFPADLAGRVSVACWRAAESAASLSGDEDADSALDDAIRACSSRVQWDLVTTRFPAVLDGVPAGDLLRDRCARLRGLASTPLCQAQ